jgi:hypothetical protein
MATKSAAKAARQAKKTASKKVPARKTANKKKAAPKSKGPKKWSARVTQTSNALDLEPHVFESRSALKIAKSLKHSAEASKRRKGTPYQSAMSMLNFYINRAGKNLPENQQKILEKAKDELRKLFGRKEEG